MGEILFVLPLIANSEDVVAVYDPISLVMGINIQSFGVPFRANDNWERGKVVVGQQQQC